MPKQLVDKLGLTQEPVLKGVVQMDGTTINTIGVINNLSLTLHACPNFSIPQDVYVIDLPPYFSMSQQDFTTNLGENLSPNWSHPFFRTRYDTKVTIKLELLANDHIESYIPKPINANLSIHNHEEQPAIQEPNTLIECIPDLILDKWEAENHEVDHFNHMDEVWIAMYMIHEKVFVPNLMNNKK